MKRIKYIIVGIVLGLSIFTISSNLFGNYYKNNLFNIEESSSYLFKINTKDNDELAKLDEIVKRNAENNYSIIIDNNVRKDDEGNVYNYYPGNENSSHNIIATENVNLLREYELSTGDGILFDPTPAHPIIIRSVNFVTTSEYAIITLNPLNAQEDGIRLLKEDLDANNLSHVYDIEEVFLHKATSNFYLLPEHSLVLLLVILFAMFVIKDINMEVKEISLRKLEGQSSVYIYCNFVLWNILISLMAMVITILFMIFMKYRVTPFLVSKFYQFLISHLFVTVIALSGLTLMGAVLIVKTNIGLSMKGFQQLEYSVIALMLVKLVLLFMLVIVTSKNQTQLLEEITYQLNYPKNVEKYKGLYIIDSSYSEGVNHSEEIKMIHEDVQKKYNGFMTICIQENDEQPLSEDNRIIYIRSGDNNRVILNEGKTLSSQQKSMLDYYNLMDLDVEYADLNKSEFIYCPYIEGDVYNERLYQKDYSLMIIELENMYEYDLNPSRILFKAENLDQAVSRIDEIYEAKGLDNHLIVKSLEDALEKSQMFSRYDLSVIAQELLMITVLVLLLNREILNNFNSYNKEENLELISLGKRKIFMMRKYILFTLVMYTLVLAILIISNLKFGVIVNFKILLFLVVVEMLSIILSMRKISYGKVKGI